MTLTLDGADPAVRTAPAIDTVSRRIDDPDAIGDQLLAAVGAAPPEQVAALELQLGDLLLALGEVEGAVRWLRTAIDHDPSLIQAHVELIFALDLLSGVPHDEIMGARRSLDRQICSAPARPPRRGPRHRAPRVGYLSGHLYDHSSGAMAAAIIARHRDLDVSVYASSPTDYATATLPAAVTRWVDVRGWAPDEIAAAIRADEIDILVDASGYVRGHHLLTFAARPAPIQVSAWGYLAGMGLSCYDALLADAISAPQDLQHLYTERCLHLPYALGFTPPPYRVPIEKVRGPVTFGHLGRLEKVSTATFDLWAEVLAACPGSRLLLKAKGLTYGRIQHRVRGEFLARGIAPERIEFRGATSRYEHLMTYNEVDVALDPTPQNGGVTTIEALWMGTPVVTLMTERLPGRMAASALDAIGRPDLTTRTGTEYVARAKAALKEPTTTLRRRVEGSVICDADALARGVEAAYRQLWEDGAG